MQNVFRFSKSYIDLVGQLLMWLMGFIGGVGRQNAVLHQTT